MDSYVVEVAMGRVRAGVTMEQFRQAAQATQAEIAALPGLIRRELLLDEGGNYVDVVYWQSLEAAQAAAAGFEHNLNLLPFFEVLDPSDARMLHLRSVLKH